ncbi:hypothetical protein [Methylopila sp. 73B]|uniref:hypothetical protein n=1 Tax=Methylopila sp. 73B TaxID=1120792 RepID=UPI0012DD8E49|nr:hypothetical protein [Methylopila sp. 73B]
MATLAAFRPRIVVLANRVVATDERFRRLKNHGALQYAYCLWGLVPGAISNEDSPFNGCSHAYLASAWSLLRHMETMPQVKEDALRLASDIEAGWARTPETLCVASAEVFHTAAIVKPAWAQAGWAWGGAGASAILMLAAGFFTARAAGARMGT